MYIWVFRFFSKPPLPPKFKNLLRKTGRAITSGISEFLSVTPQNRVKYNIIKIFLSNCSSNGNRTRPFAVKGQCPNR